MKCEDIQLVLLDYMTRELGRARSELVSEHIRKCDKCRAAAAEIRATLDLLRDASADQSGIPAQLSKDRREHMVWAIMHPVREWIDRHHVLVSIIVTFAVLAITLGVLAKAGVIWRTEREEGVTVTIGTAE